MLRQTALDFARTFIPNEKKAVPAGDNKLKISRAAAEVTDTNKDNKISQQELAKAFEADIIYFDDKKEQILKKGEKLPSANKFNFFEIEQDETRKPESLREESTYKGEQWFKDAFNPNLGLPDSPYEGIKGSSASAFSTTEIKGMIGKDFSEVAGSLKTPYDVAFLMDKGIKYQDERAGGGVGPNGTYTPNEILASGTGVCRDYHTLAVALLKENGYDAKMFGYSSSDNTFHAFAVYQDPESGKWGAIEYGKVYPPEMLDADSPEEAFLKVRPDALVLREYNGAGNPDQGMSVDKIYYTPTARAFSSFALGKHSGNIGLTSTNTYQEISGSVGKNGNWEFAARYNMPNQMTPMLDNSGMAGVWYNFKDAGIKVGLGGGYLPETFKMTVGPNDKKEIDNGTGLLFATIEGNHPKLLGVDNIANTGINLNLNSRFAGVGTLALNKSGDIKDENGDIKEENVKVGMDSAISQGLSRFNWTPDITINREFDLWGGSEKDANLYAKYGTDFDALVMASHYGTDGKGFPVTQYMEAGAEMKFDNVPGGLKLGTSVYVPIGKVHSNDYSQEALINLRVSNQYVGISTTQGKNLSIYNIDAGVNLTKGTVDTRLEAFASLEDDRIQNTLTPKAGARVSFKF